MDSLLQAGVSPLMCRRFDFRGKKRTERERRRSKKKLRKHAAYYANRTRTRKRVGETETVGHRRRDLVRRARIDGLTPAEVLGGRSGGITFPRCTLQRLIPRRAIHAAVHRKVRGTNITPALSSLRLPAELYKVHVARASEGNTIATDPRARTLLYRMMIPLRINASSTSFRSSYFRAHSRISDRGGPDEDAAWITMIRRASDPRFIIDQEFGCSDSRSDQLIDRQRPFLKR